MTALAKLEKAEWLSRILAYGFIVISGVFVLLYPPRTYDSASSIMTVGWGLLQAIPGLIALIAAIKRKYFIEWAIIGLISGGILLYGFLSWVSVLQEGMGHGGRAGDIMALFALCSARFFFLWKQFKRAEVDLEARTMATKEG